MAYVKGDFTDPAGRKFDTLRIMEIRDPKPPAGSLIVAITQDGKDVVINHPDLKPDAEGVGHIVFSPDQALNLAMLLWRKAETIRGNLCGHCGDKITGESTSWVSGRFRYCMKPECQQEFYEEMRVAVRRTDPDLAERLGPQAETFTCPKCSRTSYNPNDARERYCGACNEFFK